MVFLIKISRISLSFHIQFPFFLLGSEKNNIPKQNRVYIFVFVWVPLIHWHIVVCCMSVWSCIRGGQNAIIPLVETDGGFECFPSYLTTYTSRRVNYSTQQTSCFWQQGQGSECLLLLDPCLSLDPMGMGWAKMRNVDLISRFPFLIAV